jgi:hypothetical protein
MRQRLWHILKSDAFLAIGLNLVFLCITRCLTEIKFEESDDFYLAAMLSGAYGNGPNPHTHFLNYLLGLLLQPFYHLCPFLNWFLLAQLACIFVAFTGITSILLQRLGRPFGLAISLFFLAFFSDDLYIVVQWTKSAEFLSFAGFFILLASAAKRFWAGLVGGGFLMLCGSWIRFEGFQEMLPFMILLYVSDLGMNHRYTGIGAFLWGEKRFFIALTGIILAVFVSLQIHQRAMSEDSYRAYAEYNGVRAAVMDYSRSDPVGLKEDIEEADLRWDDYKLFKNWVFYDPDIFSLKNVRIYLEAARNNAYPLQQRLRSVLITHRPAIVSGYPIFWAFVLLLVGVAITNRRQLLPVLLAFLLTISLYIYFLLLGRLLYRLEFGLWLGVATIALWFLKTPTQFRWKTGYTVVLLLLILLFKYPLYIPADAFAERTPECNEMDKMEINSALFYAREYSAARYRSRPYQHRCYSELRKELESHPENLYMLSHLDMIRPQYCWFSPYQAVPAGYFKNQIYLGFWTVYWPDVEQSLRERGVENPLKELVKENVYVVGGTVVADKSIQEYLMRHYYYNVNVKLIKVVDGVGIYKYTAE